MTETVRAFLAIELPDEVTAALASVTEAVGNAGVRGVRVVKPQDVHLTLKFLGNVPSSEIDSIVAAVTPVVAAQRPLTVELGGTGAFPGTGRARVLWVGVGGDLTALRQLQEGIEGALEPMGHARESRGFSPHLTVARIRDGTPPADRRRAVEAASSADRFVSRARIDVRSVSLIRSILRPEGARYERLARIPLRQVAQDAG